MSIVKLNLGSDATPVAAQKQTLLTLIVPVFNEQTAIGPFLDAINPILDRMKPAIATEILFVNDGSRDGTDTLSPQDIATTVPNRFSGLPMQPPTLRVVPLEMTMDMHMVGAMYGLSDRVTLMAMGNYLTSTI